MGRVKINRLCSHDPDLKASAENAVASQETSQMNRSEDFLYICIVFRCK